MSALHSFAGELAYGNDAADEPFWEAVYREAFPNFRDMIAHPVDMDLQRKGIDRTVRLTNGLLLRIDEKKRREERLDVLIEYLSNSVTGAPGWIEKNLSIDYLAYAFMATRKCYLFCWPQLQRAWRKEGEGWKERAAAQYGGFRLVTARNVGYETHSLAVPLVSLLDAYSWAALVIPPKEGDADQHSNSACR